MVKVNARVMVHQAMESDDGWSSTVLSVPRLVMNAEDKLEGPVHAVNVLQ